MSQATAPHSCLPQRHGRSHPSAPPNRVPRAPPTQRRPMGVQYILAPPAATDRETDVADRDLARVLEASSNRARAHGHRHTGHEITRLPLLAFSVLPSRVSRGCAPARSPTFLLTFLRDTACSSAPVPIYSLHPLPPLPFPTSTSPDHTPLDSTAQRSFANQIRSSSGTQSELLLLLEERGLRSIGSCLQPLDTGIT